MGPTVSVTTTEAIPYILYWFDHDEWFAVLLSRLKAYGSKWSGWVTDGCFQSEQRVIPRKHRDKKLLIQNQDGDYVIHPAIQGMAQSLNLA